MLPTFVIPTEAGIHLERLGTRESEPCVVATLDWIPACAGMTEEFGPVRREEGRGGTGRVGFERYSFLRWRGAADASNGAQ